MFYEPWDRAGHRTVGKDYNTIFMQALMYGSHENIWLNIHTVCTDSKVFQFHKDPMAADSENNNLLKVSQPFF